MILIRGVTLIERIFLSEPNTFAGLPTVFVLHGFAASLICTLSGLQAFVRINTLRSQDRSPEPLTYLDFYTLFIAFALPSLTLNVGPGSAGTGLALCATSILMLGIPYARLRCGHFEPEPQSLSNVKQG